METWEEEEIIRMSYKLTYKQSPNYTPGEKGKRSFKYIIIHWWDRPEKKPTLGGTVAWLCNPKTRVSAHYVAEAGRVYQLVKEKDIAWHSSGENHLSIGIECNPRQSAGDYKTIAELVREIRKRRGNLPIYPHKKFGNTTCPGTYDLKKIEKLAKTPKITPKEPTQSSPEAISEPVVLNDTSYQITKEGDVEVESKKVWESKTMWAAITAVVTGLGLFFTGEQSLEELLVSVMGLVFGALRMVSSSEVKLK